MLGICDKREEYSMEGCVKNEGAVREIGVNRTLSG